MLKPLFFTFVCLLTLSARADDSESLLQDTASDLVASCRAAHKVGRFNVPMTKVVAYENCLNPGRGRVAACRAANSLSPGAITIDWWHRAAYERCLQGLDE